MLELPLQRLAFRPLASSNFQETSARPGDVEPGKQKWLRDKNCRDFAYEASLPGAAYDMESSIVVESIHVRKTQIPGKAHTWRSTFEVRPDILGRPSHLGVSITLGFTIKTPHVLL
ncbi:hypothetical protein VTN00DRAFT_3379 [Thermoascus crustaceus]|uniref:uncharacterized protein n=1 Tax=Thermoascus crustaceus TaxID=5088 RepID=UPI003742E140